jgi:two-component system OmpR family sensor kinase/two-component system sensor histidine kinase QseC
MEGLPFGLFLVMRNLLANAVLYCPPGGRVQLTTSLEGGCPVITVDDSGPGIPPENRERAFERFNRLGQYETEGVGLGLSIVLMVVELHGARISLLDSPLGGLRCQVVFGSPVPAAEPYVIAEPLPA